MTRLRPGDARDPYSPHPSQEVDVMSDELAVSIDRVGVLLDHLLDLLESGSDPRSGDLGWSLSACALPAQLLVLRASVSPGSVAELEHTNSMTCRTAEQCLRQVQFELASWDWDALDGDVLSAGAQFVLAVSDLVQLP